jgi:hypothetical protein
MKREMKWGSQINFPTYRGCIQQCDIKEKKLSEEQEVHK